MLFPIIRRNLICLTRIPGGIRLFSTNTTRQFSLTPVRSFLPRKKPILWLRRETRSPKTPKAPDSTPQPQKPSGNINSSRPPWLSGLAIFITFSTGLSVAIAYYFSRIARPTEVSYRVFEELLARGEVRSIRVSQSRELALVLLHSPQVIDGRGLFVSLMMSRAFKPPYFESNSFILGDLRTF